MKNRNKGIMAVVIVVLLVIVATVLVYNYSPKVKQAVNKIAGRGLRGSETATVKSDAKLVDGYPKTLLLISDAKIISSKQVVNGYGLVTYSAVFSTNQSVPSVVTTYSDFFKTHGATVSDLQQTNTDASFKAGSSTSSYLVTAMTKPDKTTEFTVQALFVNK